MTISGSSAINTSNYIYDKNPISYGKGNDFFQAQTHGILEHAVKVIGDNVEMQNDLEKVFFTLLDFFSTERQRIAQKTKTVDAEKFGRRRDSVEGVEDGYSYTVLSQKYEEYGGRMLALMQSKLSKMPHDLKGFKKPSLKETSKYMGRLSSFEIEVMDIQKLVEKGWHRNVDIQEIVKVCGDAPDIKEKMKRLKTKRPGLYKQDKMVFFLQAINNAFPSPKLLKIPGLEPRYIGKIENLKSHWVLATTRIQIGNKMYALSQYLTYMYLNHRSDPVERMSGKSKITTIHQDTFLVEPTLKEIAKIFKSAVEWDKSVNSLKDLKCRVGLMRYIFAHGMPTNRGSAAIGEWFEKSIYQHHGYEVPLSADGTVDLDALTSDSLSSFMEKYTQTS